MKIGFIVCAAALMVVMMQGMASSDPKTMPENPADKLGWQLVVHSYSFKQFPISQAIDKTAALGIQHMSLSGTVNIDGKRISPIELTDAQAAAIRKHLKEKGISPTFANMGVVHLSADEKEARKYFDCAKRLGINILVAEPQAKSLADLPKTMDVVEKLAKEYNIKVAIHNHPKPSFYWNPDTVLAAVNGRSALLGACADTGHWIRSGLDPVQCLRKLQGRIICLHFKDLNAKPSKSGKPHDVAWGTGISNVKGQLAELKRQNFRGDFCIEYEYHWDNSSPEIAECAKFFNQMCEELAKE